MWQPCQFRHAKDSEKYSVWLHSNQAITKLREDVWGKVCISQTTALAPLAASYVEKGITKHFFFFFRNMFHDYVIGYFQYFSNSVALLKQVWLASSKQNPCIKMYLISKYQPKSQNKTQHSRIALRNHQNKTGKSQVLIPSSLYSIQILFLCSAFVKKKSV